MSHLTPNQAHAADSLTLAADAERSLALRSSERGRGSGIRLSARRRANKRLEQTHRVVK